MQNQVFLEREFLNTLFELNYLDDKKAQAFINKAYLLAKQLPKYNNWPKDQKQFWNAEALNWRGRIDRDVRNEIKKELSLLKGKNLDLGSGSYTYVQNSVAADISEEMLLLNESKEKLLVDLEKSLPFAPDSFDSVTMVFVANYIKNIPHLFEQVHNVLRPGGKLVIIQSLNPIMKLHTLHYKNKYSEPEFRILLKKFKVSAYTKDISNHKLLFVSAEK